ncbi:MAG: NAD-dependent dehydratase [Candidatus Magasanikbacteria bacterium CG10_big_fil_rev_8_21_14_0_10_40_10]|uniref:NAD-dependent dehydratase n=1 Tax=Candidatus Magasanikbacteria bacterium CG10_big_fil_rev_8_21_14_0_10_40_10 TaxID=1974648 RepID=A0A2M6W3Z6_9BACT|nr:MAG: NAD-dependent dehydratase [Candidatus Magasanikbacteria bacterium CG10_big_fil_rev_8_21_14_0_10_40_10]
MDTPIFEKKNVLVTGGAGFIGSHLCERLLKEAKVICLDDFSNSHPDNIKHLLQYPDFEFIKCDVNLPIDLESYEELEKFRVKFQGVQEIYHLACPTSPKDFEKLKMKSLWANSSSMINTLDLAVKYHAKYVFSSSSVVYGNASDAKEFFKEGDSGIVDHLSPRACYDEGKRFAETCVETYRQVYGLDAKIARVFTTYGPHMKLFIGMLIPDFIVNALEGKDLVLYGDKNMTTSLCYVSDLVDGLARLMSADPDVLIVNLGHDNIYKLIEIAQMIIKMIGSTSKIVFEDPLVFLTRKGAPDLTYAKQALGWMPLVRLEDGLAKTINYTIANKEALLINHNA